MADFDAKLQEMQKYLPFVQNVIEKLRNDTFEDGDNPRRAQLKKMEMLQDLLKNNGKKLKMETLLKCEGVLKRLYSKIEKLTLLQNDSETSSNKDTSNISNNTTTNKVPTELTKEKIRPKGTNTGGAVLPESIEIVDITGPESPPPQPLEVEVQPVEIPTERCNSPTATQAEQTTHKHKSKHHRHDHHRSSRDRHNSRHHRHHHYEPSQNEQQSELQRDLQRNLQRGLQRDSQHDLKRDSQHDLKRDSQHDLKRDSQHDLKRDSHRDLQRASNKLNWPHEVTQKSHDSGGNRNHDSNGSRDQNRKSLTLPNFTVTRVWLDRNCRRRDNSIEDVYSPNQCWDNVSISSKNSNSPVPVISLLDNSPPPEECESGLYHDTIYNFKKNTPKDDRSVFSRVRHINIPKASAKVSEPLMSLKPAFCQSAPISVPVKVPTIPEVLKSPPLTASDITNLFKEATEETTSNIPSISEVGTRRPPKTTSLPTDSPLVVTIPTLDIARKKLSIITQNSPQPPNTPDSPVSPKRTPLNVSALPLPVERIALKYNPHPRSEHNTSSNTVANKLPANVDKPTNKPPDPRLNSGHAKVHNVSSPTLSTSSNTMAATFSNDPRLRKINSQPSLYQMPQITPSIPIPSLLTMPTVPTPFPIASAPQKYPSQSIPSLLDIPMPSIDPRINFGAQIPKPAAQIPPAHLKERKVPGIDFSCERIVKRGPAAPAASRDGYQSEENWDSDPEPIPPMPRKSLLDTPTISANIPIPPARAFGEYAKANGNNMAYMSSLSLIESGGITSIPLYGLQSSTGPHVAPSFANTGQRQYPGHSKFNALLNDKSERIKYLESKKEKHHEPRTYAEFRRAKARAAAEEQAKKAAEEAEAAKAEKEKEAEKEKDAINTDDGSSKLISQPPATSTLDKLYRSTDFNNCEFPKTKTSFKIPKKQTTTAKDEQKRDENDKVSEDKDEVVDKNKDKSVDQKKKDEKKKEVKVSKAKTENKSNNKTSSGDKDEKLSLISNKLAVKLKRTPYNVEKEKVENEAEKTNFSTDKKEKTQRKNDVGSIEEDETSKIPEPVTLETSGKATSKGVSQEVSVSELKKTEVGINMVTSSHESAVVISSSEEDGSSERRKKFNPVIEGKNLESFLSLNSAEKPLKSFMPARILQRRNTMFLQGSTPEVDKEKIFSQKALVFEDIQGANAQQRVLDITAKQRKNKCLLDIFQKTDDNCTVSTQNIISGKRRTRTTVNFNEVRRSAEVYHHRTPNEVKKEADKKIVKKQSPKSKKGKQIKSLGGNMKAKSKPELAGLGDASEGNVPNTSKQTIGTEDTAKTHQLLEGFVQDIIDPKSNKDYLFSLLGQILADDKLKLVKEIVESAAKENAVRSDTPAEIDDDDSRGGDTLKSGGINIERSNDEEAENDNGATKNSRKRKRNELDRLNEDIRDMFISSGVLTATGRRMCTLVAAERANQEKQFTDSSEEQAAVEKEDDPITPKPVIPRIRKSKVILKSINIEKYQNVSKQKAASVTESYSDESNADSTLHGNEPASNDADPNSEKSIDDTPPRNMPILKPHTPIKLSEVEDTTQNTVKKASPIKKPKIKVNKPGPKCKKAYNTYVSEEENHDEVVTTADDTKVNVVKNTNKEWHSKSKYVKWCPLCECKLSYSAIHYKGQHGEYYPSRLPPTILKELKTGQGAKPLFGVSTGKKSATYFYRCPFCLIHNCTMLQSWYDHLFIHTGEYNFECMRCHRPSNKLHQLDNHFKLHCPGATALTNPRVTVGPELIAHICHICDFLQFNRVNLEKHYINQHDYSADEVKNLGDTIPFLDTTNVNFVNKQRAIELEAAQFEQLKGNDEAGEEMFEVMKIKPKQSETEIVNKLAPLHTVVIKRKAENVTSLPQKNESEVNKFAGGMSEESSKCPRTEDDVELATNSNVFVPTRDTNDSPTMNNFAQSLLTIETEQIASKRPMTETRNIAMSMAERLSQRFKSMQERKVVSVAEDKSEAAEPAPEKAVTENETPSDASCTEHINTELDDQIQTQLNSSTESVLTTNDTVTSSLGTESLTVNGAVAATSSVLGEDDDENWEDIEITESAPSTTSSIVSTSSVVSKTSKARNKNLFQKFNRLYASNNKLKKSLSITIGNRKKPHAKESDQLGNANEEAQVNTNTTTTTTTTLAAIHHEIEHVECNEEMMPQTNNAEPILGFRPMITNLADLLPDSPCNDPIELVPELAPIESLQDLNDISSILNSDYISDIFVSNSNAVCIDVDSQQTSIQEALDFVKEQQNLQSITHTSNVQTLTLPSINRIDNIGFSKSEENTFKFYCLSENCTFLYSNEAIGLENHFILEHAQIEWKGYCHVCKTNVDGPSTGNTNPLPLSAELRHMNEKHVLELPTTENDQLKGDRSNSSEDRPRIKIRRLTGDCLSTTPTPTPTAISKTINAFDENAQTLCATSTSTQAHSSSNISVAFLNVVEPNKNTVEKRHFQQISAATNTMHSVTQNSNASGSACSLMIANVVSLNEHNARTDNALPANKPEKSKGVTPTTQLPIISNVCSLNATDVLWTQHSVNEREGLERSSAESLEVSHILAEADAPSLEKHGDKVTPAAGCDSPEPQVVAETMPYSQATSGDFLITQTVSAQYEEGHVGFNISIAPNPTARSSRSNSGSCSSLATTTSTTAPLSSFKCQANGCKYQTCLSAAMGDHLRFHERQNFSAQRDYLRCSHCPHVADEVEAFLQHAEDHFETATPANEGGEKRLTLTQKIQNMLREATGRSKRVSVDGIYDTNTNSSRSSSNDKEINETEKSYRAELEETVNEIVATTGVPDSKLYRCPIDGCKTALTETTYYAHVVYHLTTLGNLNINNYTYKCPHCTAAYQRPHKIKVHIKTHAFHRYFCYICTITTNSVDDMVKHFTESHYRCKNLRTTPLFDTNAASDGKRSTADGKKTASKSNFYVVYSQILDARMLQQFGEKLIADWKVKKVALRTHFKPSEIGLLPLTPIFEKELNCAVCPYKTKVRTNLTRHLQMHNDDTNGGGQHLANVDPVNPVPCLSSNERHFDKMTNLASSSLVVGNTTTATGKILAKLPYDYVPETKRYICGVSGCQYLTISEEIFRSHLNALHSEILAYNCPHCKEEICKRNMSAERILNHLRFHSAKLFQCEECEYLHYMKSVVDRHVRTHDKQPPGAAVNVVTHDRSQPNAADKLPNTPTKPEVPAATTVRSDPCSASKTKFKWSCSLCSHRVATQQQIVMHCTNQHGCKHQYQCIHCTFGATQLSQIMTHIDEKHPNGARRAHFMFHKMEGANIMPNAIDTRPLWLRDDPTRVRHIRGILMEDEEESERYRKRLRLDESDESESTVDAEEPHNAAEDELITPDKSSLPQQDNLDANLYLGCYKFSCFYCTKEFLTFDELRTVHFPTAHASILEKKAFRFRLCPQLGCTSCQDFVGNSFEIKEHLKNDHNSKRYSATDPRSTTSSIICGHCNYSTDMLTKFCNHVYRVKHKPWDIKLLSLEQLEVISKMSAAVVNIQCNKCLQVFAQPSAFNTHAFSAHAGMSDVTYRDVTGMLIYQCPMCVYTATKEMLTLRHMIDHYGGFKRCVFCSEPQTNFNGYMQHCYSDHREEIKNEFKTKYSFMEMKRFLQQVILVFPSGFVASLENLRATECSTAYGDKHIKQLYDEILRTSQQPPIPRLSIGRLVASKSMESQKQQAGSSASTAAAMQLAGNRIKDAQLAFTAQPIMKRRSTVALGRDDIRSDFLAAFEKKRKIQANLSLLPPAPPMEPPIAAFEEESNSSVSVSDCSDDESNLQLQPFSYYGKLRAPIDLTKVFIKIAAGDAMETKVSVEKFKLLYKIEPRVILENMDLTPYGSAKEDQKTGDSDDKIKKPTKPCPASHKYKYR